MEDRADLDGELFLASATLPTLLLRKPDALINQAASRAGYFTVRPAHLRDFVDANLLIAKVLDRIYECDWIFHYCTIMELFRLVKYITTSLFVLECLV